MSELSISGLYKRLGDRQVLSGFSARLPMGELSVLMGPSGCGKTTLLRILAKLEQPDAGQINVLDGLAVSMAFQEDRLCPCLSAAANLDMVLCQGRAQAVRQLEKIGLDAIAANTPACQLSGGQARRVSLLRALLYPADLYLLDEPFRGLDEESRRLCAKKISELGFSKTLLVVTHRQEDAALLKAKTVVTFSGS